MAIAQPQGIAFAGIGGRAGAGPIGTAIVGKSATAIAGPSATAISLDESPTITLTPVHKLTSAYVAKYAPELGVYKVAEIKGLWPSDAAFFFFFSLLDVFVTISLREYRNWHCNPVRPNLA